ncbi:MAG: hypothetical protein WBO23_14530 [Burkholderiales bacterium]
MNSGLWIILLEAGLALAILLFVVWWTLPKKPKGGERSGPGPGDSGTPRG